MRKDKLAFCCKHLPFVALPKKAVLNKFHGDVHALEQALGVDVVQHETAFVQGLGAFGAGADADERERMANNGEERTFSTFPPNLQFIHQKLHQRGKCLCLLLLCLHFRYLTVPVMENYSQFFF